MRTPPDDPQRIPPASAAPALGRAPDDADDGKAVLWIGDWELDASLHRLRRGDMEKRLTRQQVELLQALAEREGESWSREALIERVWQRRAVADEVLSRAVAQLRRLLEDDARQPAYIETLHKTGYRLLVPVRRGARSRPSPADAADERPTAATSEFKAESTARPEAVPPAPSRVAEAGGTNPRRWQIRPTVGGLLMLITLLAAAWLLLPQRVVGTTAQRLAQAESFISTGGRIGQPRFSSDGTQVLWLDHSADGSTSTLRISDASGRPLQTLPLTSSAPRSAVFAVDGRSVYYLARTETGCDLREYVLPNGPERALGSCHDASLGLEAEPGGSVLLTGPDGALQRRWTDRADAQSLTRPGCANCSDSHPRRAADGRIAFLRGHPGQRAVWLLEQGVERKLSRNDDGISGLAFDPHSADLIVASNAFGSPALLAVDLRSGASRLLGARGASSLDISVRGEWVFEQRRYETPLWRRTGNANAVRLTHSLRFDGQPALAPDGRRLAYVSNRSGYGGIWLLDLETGADIALPLPAARAWTRPRWSADGRSLWLTRYDEHGIDAVRVDPDSARLLPLPTGLQEAEEVQQLADDTYIFAVRRNEQRSLRVRHGAHEEDVEGSTGVSAFEASSSQLAFQLGGEPGVQLRPLLQATAGVDRSVVAGSPWTLQQDRLLYYSPEHGGQILSSTSDGSAPEALMSNFGARPESLAARPGERLDLIFGRLLKVEIELMRVPAPAPR
jgi:DNA-binding winged helix-turn-helix (wHTH) protein/Tol biopolymer transport system component